MKSKRQSGRISLLGLGGIAIVVMVVASLFLAKEDPTATGGQFMDALARHDVDKLTELTLIDSADPQHIEADKKHLHDEWDFCVNVAGEHYPFIWKVTNSNTAADGHASVTLEITKITNNSYPEKFELPLEKVNGKWLVDVRGISRLMFPALPE